MRPTAIARETTGFDAVPFDLDGFVTCTAKLPAVACDPAVVRALLVTTQVDATGLIVYFLLARAILAV